MDKHKFQIGDRIKTASWDVFLKTKTIVLPSLKDKLSNKIFIITDHKPNYNQYKIENDNDFFWVYEDVIKCRIGSYLGSIEYIDYKLLIYYICIDSLTYMMTKKEIKDRYCWGDELGVGTKLYVKDNIEHKEKPILYLDNKNPSKSILEEGYNPSEDSLCINSNDSTKFDINGTTYVLDETKLPDLDRYTVNSNNENEATPKKKKYIPKLKNTESEKKKRGFTCFGTIGGWDII